MPRIARVVVAGAPHHVTQRGNRREDIFFGDDDRQRFLQLFLEYSQKLVVGRVCRFSRRSREVLHTERIEMIWCV